MKLPRSHAARLRANPSRAGWLQVGLMALSIGLSIIAGQMLRRKNRNPIEDDKPTTLSTRGSFVPWYCGIRRVGPVFLAAPFSDREKRKEEVDGYKGLSSPKQDVWYESGWHGIGVGPLHYLYGIEQQGRRIFNGPITPDSHPSGTTVDLGAEGAFQIYWGEPDQPVNTFLGDVDRVGISSRWPHLAYIVWNKKRLGSSPVWPLLNYIVGRRPTNTELSLSQGWYDPSITLTGDTYNIIGSLSNADQDIGYLEFNSDETAHFKPAHFIEITGNGLADGTYEILRSTVVVTRVGTTAGGYDIYATTTRVFLVGGTLGANSSGSVETYENAEDDGVNIAHAIAEMLFAPFPQGLCRDPDHLVEKWDLDSLEALGVEAETDGWRSSILASEGETCESLFGAILQDHGVLLPIDTADGSLTFQRVREPVGTLPNIPVGLFASQLAEVNTSLGEQPVDREMFTFSDRAYNFADMTITVDEDGQASREEVFRSRRVPIVSTVRFETAALLTELRSPEELAQSSGFRLSASREVRALIPGQAVTVEGYDEVMRLISITIDEQSEAVALELLPDFYGARKSDFIIDTGGGQVVIRDPEQDEQFAWAEVPEQVLGAFPATQTVLVPRIRAHSLISNAALWISRDNSTYTLFGYDDFVQTGGTLDAQLDADGPTYIPQGPEYTELGPDNGSLIQDLSADLTNWGLGRQLCVIVSTNGVEICFLQKATVTGMDTRRLDGLLRARYDTRKLTHPAGSQVYIFDRDMITPVQDVLLEPEEDLFAKSQPGTTAGQVNLSAVPPYSALLYGKGQRPIAPDYVRVKAPALNVPAYQTGTDITVAWALSTGSVGTGAGLQGAGVALGPPDIPGNVQLEVLDSSGTLRTTIGVTAEASDYTITNAELVSIFGSEPSSFRIRAIHVANGRSSATSPTLTITRV